MRFDLVFNINYPLNKVEEAFLSEDYIKFLKENHSKVENIEVKKIDKSGKIVRREVLYEPKPIIEKIGPQQVPKGAMSWTEVSTYNLDKHEMEFDNIPIKQKVRKLMVNKGKMRLESIGDSRTRRILEGDLKINVFMIGKIAEKIIYQQAEKILDEENKLLEKFIAQKK